MHQPRIFVRPLACLAVLICAAPSIAQLSNLDPNALVEGLRKERMSELLRHYVDTEKGNFKDPTTSQVIVAQQYLLDYALKGTAAGTEPDPARAEELKKEALAAQKQAIDQYRRLIEENPGHEQRGLWQTDLAEQLLAPLFATDTLYGGDFYELGVPTKEQRAAYEANVAEALEHVSQAYALLNQQQGDLPREPDHTVKRINTGLWPRMMEEYFKKRTTFFLGQASYLATLLPDGHPYYQDLGKNPRMPVQAKTSADERARLRNQAVELLSKWVADKLAKDGDYIRNSSLSLAGRSQMASGRLDEAITSFDEVINQRVVSDRVYLVSSIAKAKALDLQNNLPAALELLEREQKLGLPAVDLIFRLLVVDQRHLLLRKKALALPAEQQAMALQEAYQPYLDMLAEMQAEPALAALTEQLKRYIYRRWEDSIPPDMNLANQPAAVVAAIGEMSQIVASEMIDQADYEQDPGKRQQLLAEARTKLERSIKVNRDLLKRPDVANNNAVRAQALYTLAAANFLFDRNDLPRQVETASLLVEMADLYPDQPMAETAIDQATQLLRALYDNPARPGGTVETYEKAMKVILAKYPASKAADAQRLFYADALLIPNSRWAETVEVLKDVPAGHKDYFLSQRLLVVALHQVFRALPADAGSDRDAAAQRAIAEADRIMREGERGMQQGDEDAKQAAGWARLVRADMAIEYENDIEKALSLLREFDVTFAGDDALIREMLQKRIVGNLKVENLKEAVAEARRMMGAFPNQAAAVISRVLDELKTQMDGLTARIGAERVEARKAQLRQQLTARADAAVELASMLNNWAAGQKFNAEELVPFKLIFVQALRLNGNYKDAVAIAEPLAAQFPKDATVLFNLAESLYHLGREASPVDEKLLTRADGYYKQVIEGLRPENGKFPAIWWNSWLRWLQIRDALNKNTQDIPTTVRNLRSRDPGLGGEQFKKDFETLEVKHGVR